MVGKHMKDGKVCDCGRPMADCAGSMKVEDDFVDVDRDDGDDDQPRDEQGRWTSAGGGGAVEHVAATGHVYHASPFMMQGPGGSMQHGYTISVSHPREPGLNRTIAEVKNKYLEPREKSLGRAFKAVQKHQALKSTQKFQKKGDGVTRVSRFDRGELAKPKRMDNGWLRVDGRLTRTGVFLYRNGDGSERRELRLPEEVFDSEAMRSFELVPVTDDHPPEFLDSNNTKEWARGAVSDAVGKDENFVRASMLVTDSNLVGKMLKGDAVEVSCGYTCDLEEKTGTYNGEKYDCIQRGIRGNHVAIVPRGRAGPEARVRVDGASFQVVEDSKPSKKLLTSEKRTVNKIKIDGIEYDVGSDAAIQAQAKLDAKRDAELADAKAKLDAAQAKADAAEEKANKLTADMKAMPSKVQAELRARLKLEDSARQVLGKGFKFDALSDSEIKVAMLKKLKPEVKVDGRSEAYIEARLDAAIEDMADDEGDDEGDDEKNDGNDSGVFVDGDDSSDETGFNGDSMSLEEANKPHSDSSTAYKAMVLRGREAWRGDITPSAAELKAK